MKVSIANRLEGLLNEDDVMYIAKTLGCCSKEVEIDEFDLIKASELHLDRMGYIPAKWSNTIKVLILSDSREDDWFNSMDQMIASRKEVA